MTILEKEQFITANRLPAVDKKKVDITKDNFHPAVKRCSATYKEKEIKCKECLCLNICKQIKGII